MDPTLLFVSQYIIARFLYDRVVAPILNKTLSNRELVEGLLETYNRLTELDKRIATIELQQKLAESEHGVRHHLSQLEPILTHLKSNMKTRQQQADLFTLIKELTALVSAERITRQLETSYKGLDQKAHQQCLYSYEIRGEEGYFKPCEFYCWDMTNIWFPPYFELFTHSIGFSCTSARIRVQTPCLYNSELGENLIKILCDPELPEHHPDPEDIGGTEEEARFSRKLKYIFDYCLPPLQNCLRELRGVLADLKTLVEVTLGDPEKKISDLRLGRQLPSRLKKSVEAFEERTKVLLREVGEMSRNLATDTISAHLRVTDDVVSYSKCLKDFLRLQKADSLRGESPELKLAFPPAADFKPDPQGLYLLSGGYFRHTPYCRTKKTLTDRRRPRFGILAIEDRPPTTTLGFEQPSADDIYYFFNFLNTPKTSYWNSGQGFVRFQLSVPEKFHDDASWFIEYMNRLVGQLGQQGSSENWWWENYQTHIYDRYLLDWELIHPSNEPLETRPFHIYRRGEQSLIPLKHALIKSRENRIAHLIKKLHIHPMQEAGLLARIEVIYQANYEARKVVEEAIDKLAAVSEEVKEENLPPLWLLNDTHLCKTPKQITEDQLAELYASLRSPN